METTKLKPEFEAKLRELKVLSKWKKEYLKNCKEEGCNPNFRILGLNNLESFRRFISGSIYWAETKDGHSFWHNISLK